jgi:photosystem II stability/assembly factor-like uncharacterized protein
VYAEVNTMQFDLFRFSRGFAIRQRIVLLALGLGSPLLPSAWGAPQEGSYGVKEEQQRHEALKAKYVREHSDPSGRIRPDLWRKGMKHVARMPTAPHIGIAGPASAPHLAAATHPIPADLSSVTLNSRWISIGPAPIRDFGAGLLKKAGPAGGTVSGLVTDIAIDPRGTADTTIYIATDAGGIWKSADGGASWTPKTDDMPAITMGAVALDPANPSIVYAGSGSLFNFGDFHAAGVYKSVDGGDTWQILNPGGIFTNVGINRMVLPKSDTLLVGAADGLHRLTANGATVTTPLRGVISDLKLDTGSPNIVYAAVAGSGIFKSTDAGLTFAPTPFFSAGSKGLPSGLVFAGIVLAQSTAPNSGSSFYASAVLTVGQPLLFCGGPMPNPTVALYTSTDRGQNWSEIRLGPEVAGALATVIAGTPSTGFQTIGYDMTLGVDPQKANAYYFGLKGMNAATDGGLNGLRDKAASVPFAPCTSALQDNRIDDGGGHADHHAIAFSPPSHIPNLPPGTPVRPTTVFLGNDGGLIRTADAGLTYSYLNTGLSTILMQSFDIGRGSKANNAFSYGAAQDNGVFSHTPAQSGLEWIQGADSDGSSVAADPVNASHALGSDSGTFYTTTDGQHWTPSSQLPGNVRPIAFDPNGRRAYAASGQRFFQSLDNGGTFSLIQTFPQAIFSIGQSKIDSNTIWLGFADGTLQFTKNALTLNPPTWNLPPSQPAGVFGQGVATLAVDPTNTLEIVAVFPGMSAVDALTVPSRHVFLTSNAGATWDDISGVPNGGIGNLPNLPVWSIVIDPNTTPHTFIVAGDGGVFQSVNRGRTWQRLGVGLPNAEMNMLALDSGASPELLRVASWGRGAFELALPPSECELLRKKVQVLSSNLRNLEEALANGEIPLPPVTAAKIAAVKASIRTQGIELAKQQQLLQQCERSNQ